MEFGFILPFLCMLLVSKIDCFFIAFIGYIVTGITFIYKVGIH